MPAMRGQRLLTISLLAAASLCGCASMTSSLDRLMPPWGPPEQWEPSDVGQNYADVFAEAEDFGGADE